MTARKLLAIATYALAIPITGLALGAFANGRYIVAAAIGTLAFFTFKLAHTRWTKP
jgi:hypothetical protein